MTDKPVLKKPRPYWHVDAKWICGILLLFSLGLTELIFAVYILLARENAVPIMTTVVAALSSRKGLDDETEIIEMKAKLALSPTKSLEVFPGVTVTADQIEGKTPREIRLAIFRPLAESIYERKTADIAPPAASAGQAQTPSSEQNTASEMGFLAFINKEAHASVGAVFKASAAAALVLAFFVVFFSYRFGRIGSLGFVMLVSTFPGLIAAAFLAAFISSNPPTVPPPVGEGPNLGYVAANALPLIVPTVAGVYATTALAGLGLTGLAVLGSIIFRIIRRLSHKAAPTPIDLPVQKAVPQTPAPKPQKTPKPKRGKRNPSAQ